MSNIRFSSVIAGVFCSAVAFASANLTPVFAAAKDYQFELVGQPKSMKGMSTVSVRLVHLPDRKPVMGAVIFQTRADMGPEQMASMTAPVKAVSNTVAGVYSFEIQNGTIWNKPGKWALTLAAKVQGEPETVGGSVTVNLAP